MENKPPIETINTLHKCAEIEEVLGKMYDMFAEAYQEHPEISQVFKKTAGEERNHEYQIRLAIKSFCPTIESMALTTEEADKHLSMVRDFLEKLNNGIPDIEEALDIALKLEDISTRFHMDAAARFSDPSCAKLFKAMMAADEDHVATLEQTLKKLRTSGTPLA
jgi:rubrerythrin